MARYEQWLLQNEAAINEQLKYYETEITKLRKQRKSLNSKQRTFRTTERLSKHRSVLTSGKI